MMLYLRNGIRLQHAIRGDMSKAVGLNLQLFYLSNPTSDVRRSNRHAIAIDPINGRAAAPLDQELALVDAALPGANRRSSFSLFQDLFGTRLLRSMDSVTGMVRGPFFNLPFKPT